MSSNQDDSANKFWTLGDDATLEEDILDIIAKKKMPNPGENTNLLTVPTTNRFILNHPSDYIRESPNENIGLGKSKSKKNVNFIDGSREDSDNMKTDESKRAGLIDHLRYRNSPMKKSSNFVNLDNIFKEDVPDYQNKTGIITDKRPRVIVERDHTGKYRLTVKGNFDPSPERINKTMGEKPDRNNLMRQSWDVAVRDIEINAKDTFERNEGLLRSKFGLAPQKDNEKNENYKSAPQLVNPRADLFKYSYVAKYQKKDNDFNINAYLNEHYTNPVFKASAINNIFGRPKYS